MKFFGAVLLALAVVSTLPVRSNYETKKFDSGPVACGTVNPVDSAFYVVDTADAGVVDIEQVSATLDIEKTAEPSRRVTRRDDPVAMSSRAYYFRYKNLRKAMASMIGEGQPEPLSRQSA